MQDITVTPNKESIERLSSIMKTMPQAQGMETTHSFVAGMYLRKLWRPAGTIIVGKVHKAAHFFVCVSGEIIAWSETGMRHLRAGDVIESQPGTKRVTYAVTDAIGMTIHKTDNTDLDAIEDELLEKDDTALFDSSNKCLINVPYFRELTAQVILDEKPGFWSDWTKEQQGLYTSGDWRAFSVSRGYSEAAINKYQEWMDMVADAKAKGLNPFACIVDLTTEAAMKNIALDKKGEIMKSSHAPFESREVML